MLHDPKHRVSAHEDPVLSLAAGPMLRGVAAHRDGVEPTHNSFETVQRLESERLAPSARNEKSSSGITMDLPMKSL